MLTLEGNDLAFGHSDDLSGGNMNLDCGAVVDV